MVDIRLVLFKVGFSSDARTGWSEREVPLNRVIHHQGHTRTQHNHLIFTPHKFLRLPPLFLAP